MASPVLANAELGMQRTIEALERDLQRIRVGGASASLVDGVRVDYQGRRARLIEIATVTIPDPRQIVIRPWDPNSLRAIGSAISQSRIGLTPTIDGPAIRVYVPAMTEDRRRELVDLVHKRLEQARVEMRVLRHEALAAVRTRDGAHPAGVDEIRRDEALLQRMTDRYVAEVDRLGRIKEDRVLRF